jgi:hypothetical protein
MPPIRRNGSVAPRPRGEPPKRSSSAPPPGAKPPADSPPLSLPREPKQHVTLGLSGSINSEGRQTAPLHGLTHALKKPGVLPPDTGVSSFEQWPQRRLSQGFPAPIEHRVQQATANAGGVHFNLEGMSQGDLKPDPARYGGRAPAGSTTNWELNHVQSDPNVKVKTSLWNKTSQGYEQRPTSSGFRPFAKNDFSLGMQGELAAEVIQDGLTAAKGMLSSGNQQAAVKELKDISSGARQLGYPEIARLASEARTHAEYGQLDDANRVIDNCAKETRLMAAMKDT